MVEKYFGQDDPLDEIIRFGGEHDLRVTGFMKNTPGNSHFVILMIACINYMNLTTARSTHRGKEIGIRKVLGASVGGISILLSKEFIRRILIANVIAWPVAYFYMDKWL